MGGGYLIRFGKLMTLRVEAISAVSVSLRREADTAFSVRENEDIALARLWFCYFFWGGVETIGRLFFGS